MMVRAGPATCVSSEPADLHERLRLPGGGKMPPRLLLDRIDRYLAVDIGLEDLRDAPRAARHRLARLLLRMIRRPHERPRLHVREAHLLLPDLLPATELVGRHPPIEGDVMLRRP